MSGEDDVCNGVKKLGVGGKNGRNFRKTAWAWQGARISDSSMGMPGGTTGWWAPHEPGRKVWVQHMLQEARGWWVQHRHGIARQVVGTAWAWTSNTGNGHRMGME